MASVIPFCRSEPRPGSPKFGTWGYDPLVASLAKRHFSIAKDDPADRPREGATTRAEVRELAEAEVVGELVRMLGADGGDAAARRHARELRRAA